MRQVIKKDHFFLRFLFHPEYRMVRHFVLVVFFAMICINLSRLPFLEYADQTDHYLWYEMGLLLLLFLGVVYLNRYIWIPRLLFRKRYCLYGVCLGGAIVLLLFASYGGEYLLYRHYRLAPGAYSYFSPNRIFGLDLVANFVLYAICCTGSSVTLLFRYWMDGAKQANELEKANLSMELQRLKNQMNPQFLFALLEKAAQVVVKDPEQASAILMQLSKLLRYQLYDGCREHVFLVSDIAFSTYFLSLQKYLYPGLDFSISTTGDIRRVLLPPLLFLPFLETFTSRMKKGGKESLHLSFEIRGRELHFECLGSIPKEDLPVQENAELEDIRRRLGLLFTEVCLTENKGIKPGIHLCIRL